MCSDFCTSKRIFYMHIFRIDPILSKASGPTKNNAIMWNIKFRIIWWKCTLEIKISTLLKRDKRNDSLLQKIFKKKVCVQHKFDYAADSRCVVLPITLLSNYILWQQSSLSSSVCHADSGQLLNRSSFLSVILISEPSQLFLCTIFHSTA